jgi:hypothetical protein
MSATTATATDISVVTISSHAEGTLLAFDSSSVILQGISPGSIDSGDFLFV